MTTTKPTQDEVNEFLDELRESGITNMFGARPYVMREFPTLAKEEAGTMLSEWMRTFGTRHDAASRTPDGGRDE